MSITYIKCMAQFINKIVNDAERRLYIYGAGGYMWKIIMSGAMDSIIFPEINWRDYISGYIDKKAYNKHESLEDLSFLSIEQFKQTVKEHKASVFISIGMGKRHTLQYESIIQQLDAADTEIDVMTVYDAVVNSKYFREDHGVIEAPGLLRVINQSSYISSSPWYFNKLYDKYKLFDSGTGKRIMEYAEICSSVILNTGGGICLRDNRGWVNVINGRRITYWENKEYQNKIHFFGDSRTLCVHVDDFNTIPSLLQKRIYNESRKIYRVLNYGMPGFDIERIFYQINNVKYNEGDIIVVAGWIKLMLTQKNIKIWSEFMSEICNKCEKENMKLVLVHLPNIYELVEHTYVEQHILDINSWIIFNLDYENVDKWPDFKKWCESMNVEALDMCEFQNDRYKYGEIYIDTQHYACNGNMWISDKLFEVIEGYSNNGSVCYSFSEQFGSKENELIVSRSNNYFKRIEQYENDVSNTQNKKAVEQYLNDYKELAGECKKTDRVGAIVMNCNPFTLGHRYLIEEAGKRTDKLIIFVVEENKSFFSIEDRLLLVRQGTQDLKNVEIIPSGKFIISSLTFPEYFMKEKLNDTFINPTDDLSMFGKYIVPFFNIKVRFVGEEPFDPVTSQYNDAMREVLEDYGIRVLIIPRKESDGAAISASRVRSLLKSKEFEKIKNLVPDTTYKYLLKKYSV